MVVGGMERQQESAIVNTLLALNEVVSSTLIRLPSTECVAISSKNKGIQMNRMLGKAGHGVNELGMGLEK